MAGVAARYLLLEADMSCQKGKPIREAKPGDFRCKECGFVSAKKKKLCKPKKVK
jgi:hypothetical protein